MLGKSGDTRVADRTPNPNRQLAVDVVSGSFCDSKLSVWGNVKSVIGNPSREQAFVPGIPGNACW